MGLAYAQAGAKLTLRHVESQDFPVVVGFLDARDAGGALVADLDAKQLSVVEDGRPLPVSQLRLAETGLNLYVLVDPSQAFAIRNPEGDTRFDLVRQQLLAWASPQPDTEDLQLSLITEAGALAQNVVASALVSALENYEPNTNIISNDLAILDQALNVLAQSDPRPGMGKALWVISAVPPIETMENLAEWRTALEEQAITLFIWLVDTPGQLASQEASALQDLAANSGGQSFLFSADEAFPEPDDYFAPLSQAYYFQYESPANTSGEHSVQVQWESEAGVLNSQELSYTLNILPPNPIFVTPPSQIERSPYEDDPSLLSPFSQPLEILIEFPDNFEREVVRSSLYVNDQLVAENRSEPFNNFIWDLQPYDSTQQLRLQVEVEDELGLIGRSAEHNLQITTQATASWFQVLLARGAPALAFSVVLIAAGAVFLVLVLSGRIKPPALQTTQQEEDVVDPANPRPAAAGARAKVPDPDDPLPMPAPRALAFLQGLNADGRVERDLVQPVTKANSVIGSLADACDIVLQGDTVDPKHARLTQLDNGLFVLADMGSEAGTWLNYAPVSSEGSRVEEGDLVHIGREAFRFSLLPPKIRSEV
jgi:hypothetical protein